MSKNKAKQATDAYLESIGLDPSTIPDPSKVASIAHAHRDHMAWEGEAFDRLSGDFEFYRATRLFDGQSIRSAKSEGYVELPKGADVRMVGCHDPENEVVMIRRKEAGAAFRAERQRQRAKSQTGRYREQKGAGYDAEVTAHRHEFTVKYDQEGGV